MDKKILIVDDEPINIQVLKNHLTANHYKVTQALNGKSALAALDREENIDLILLDVMMPNMSGYEVCAKIREKYPAQSLPILMLTAKNQVADLVMGFQFGANDYLTKPFEVEEMLARVRALLRRTDRIPQAAKHSEILNYGPLTLVPERFEAIWFAQTVKLTHLEFELLHCLLQRHGQTVSPSEILREVWGYDPDDDIETIRVHIRHLRTKLEPDPRHPRYIKTVYGRSEEHTSELQSRETISYAVFCLKKKKKKTYTY